MSEFPIEQPEPNGSCAWCGGPTYNDDFCRIDCQHAYSEGLKQGFRRQASERELNAMFAEAEREEEPEDAELDINMESLRDQQTNRAWISDQSSKVKRDFRRMRG